MTRGSVVLAGRDRGGSWWYELVANGPNPDGCWDINSGSFDQGTTIWFSSGLRVPKAAGFKLVDSFDVPVHSRDNRPTPSASVTMAPRGISV
jgi:hypothetical protein